MTDILGYDCDGSPLRAGDRVKIMDARFNPNFIGLTVTAIDSAPLGDGDIQISIRHPQLGRWYESFPGHLRLIRSGRELFDKCASEAGKIKTGETA